MDRLLKKIIESRLAEATPLIQVVIGPRQVGKTTALVSALNKRGVYETADFPTPLPHTVIAEWWERATQHSDKILAIDEIQKISGWSEVLKAHWDRAPKQLKVVVTGSSALLVEKGLKESLAGRFELIRAEHWNLAEAKRIFDVTRDPFLEFGCYPGSIPLQGDIDRWGQYIRDAIIEPALGRDLLQLHPVDQPALLRQTFGVACTMPAQIISLQKLQGQLQGKGTLPTLKQYLELLADAFLVTGLQKYSPRPLRTKKSSPKLIVHDNGLLRALRRPIQPALSAEEKGRYLENAIGARFVEAGWETYYWKERDLEVDLVVLGPNGEKWAIEVKSTQTSIDALKGLHKFCTYYPEFEPCLISLAGQTFEGIRSLAVDDILSMCRPYRSIPL